jgi:two-component system NtrC family sensor kinase
LSVSDTGVGIPTENLQELFTAFFTTKSPGRGTGLGLSISHGIIEEHEGQILVSSQTGSGSTFTIVLPERKQP